MQITPAPPRTDSPVARNARTSRREIEGAPPPRGRSPSLTSNAPDTAGSPRRVALPATAPTETATAAAAPAETAEQYAARREGVHAVVSGYFQPHVTEAENREAESTDGESTDGESTDGEESHADALNRLIGERVQGLMDMGETRESIETTFAKARRHDIAAEGARGFVGSIPFGVASRLLDTKPAIGDTVVSGLNALPGLKHAPDAFKGGVAAGLVSGVADHIGSQALTPAMEDIQWLASSAEQLEEPMQEAKKHADAGMLRAVGQNAAAIQTFTARNIIRGVVGPALTAAGHVAAATQTDSWLAAIGSPLAGAGFNLANRHFAEQDHRVGPEYLLGRTDWEDQYQALKEATWKGAVANGTGRVAKAVVNTVDATLSAPRTMLSATSLSTNVGALGVGLGAVSMATSAAGALAEKHGASAAGIVAAEHAARTISSAGVFASWTTAAVVTQPAVDALRGVSDATGDLAKKGVSSAVQNSAEAIGSTAQQSADYVGPKLISARDATVRTGQEAIRGASAAFDSVKTTTSNAISDVSTAVGTGFSNAGTRLNGMLDSASNNLSDAVANMRRRTRPQTDDPAQNPQNIPLGNMNV